MKNLRITPLLQFVKSKNLLKIFLLLLLFAANLSNAVNLGRLNAQCSSQIIVTSGVTYPNNLRGQIFGVSSTALPPITYGGNSYITSTAASNDHLVVVRRTVNGTFQGETFHWVGVNPIGGGQNLSGSYLYSVPNASQVTTKYSFYRAPNLGSSDELLGVTAWDLVVISQHLPGSLNPVPFTKPHQYIATDVDNNKTITSKDRDLIQGMIMGQYSSWQAFLQVCNHGDICL